MNGSIRVLVVDDSAATRGMLREALSLDGGIDVIGEAGSGPEAVARAAELHPDVILMDVRMPDGDGKGATRAILGQNPATRIVALTWSDDPASVRDMLAAGAIGYVVKGGTIDELAEAIRHASAGEAELDQRVIPAAVEDLRRLLEEERDRREEVERLARAREEFVQVLSHELRTPLTIISGVLRLLQSGGGEVRGTQEEAQLIDSALGRASELEFLVEGLELIASGPDTGTHASPGQAIGTASARLGEGADVVTTDPEPWAGVPQRMVDRVAFELLSNATRHGRRPIEVWTGRDGADAVLAITDSGGWEPEAEQFAAFLQGDMSTTRSQGGFGLGLFVASRLCQACNGTLAIHAVDGHTRAQARFPLPRP